MTLELETSKAELVATDFGFLEGLRWRGGRLWASSVNDKTVLSLGEGGWCQEVDLKDDSPSGLGWMPDGAMAVVAMKSRQLRQFHPDRPPRVTPLDRIAPFHCNDLLVTPTGDAFISHFGYDPWSQRPNPRPAWLIKISQDGPPRLVGEPLQFPNGMALSHDASSLYVAETDARRISVFDFTPDGRLGRRRTLRDLGDARPDAIAGDAGGGIWVCCIEDGLIRISADGDVTDQIKLSAPAYACALGGDDGRDLYCSTFLRNPSRPPAEVRTGQLLRIRVDWPATGH